MFPNVAGQHNLTYPRGVNFMETEVDSIPRYVFIFLIKRCLNHCVYTYLSNNFK